MRELILSIFKKDQGKRFDLFHYRIDLSMTKIIDLIEKPMIKFPTLITVCQPLTYCRVRNIESPQYHTEGSQYFRYKSSNNSANS